MKIKELFEAKVEHIEAAQKRNIFREDEDIAVNNFLKSLTPSELRYFSIRDNCGPAALAFIDYAKDINLKRIRGYFKADKVVSDKADFTKQMRNEFRASGLDFNSASDRQTWILNSKYAEDWKLIPHYWVEDSLDRIIDPIGKIQFVDSGLATDLDMTRYIKA